MVLIWEKAINGMLLTSSERDIWSNHYVPSSLKLQSFLNPFNSEGESAKDFIWETKSISIQNSAWIGAVKKTEVVFNS